MSPLPRSIELAGYLTPLQLTKRTKFRRLMIGTEGAANSGKTEFAMTAPGPSVVLCLDRGYEAMLKNPEPPETRRQDVGFKVVQAPLATQSNDPKFYLAYWQQFYANYLEVLALPEARTVTIDGDSDSWELQQLAEFGRLTQIPQLLRTSVNAARRAMYARAHDSGKIIIATNKLRQKWQDKFDMQGNPVLTEGGKQVREWDGKSYDRSGFGDHDYLWEIQLRHLYQPATFNERLQRTLPQKWGIRILMCKANRGLEGSELWGEDCNFASLVSLVYPHIPLGEWGF